MFVKTIRYTMFTIFTIFG